MSPIQRIFGRTYARLQSTTSASHDNFVMKIIRSIANGSTQWNVPRDVDAKAVVSQVQEFVNALWKKESWVVSVRTRGAHQVIIAEKLSGKPLILFDESVKGKTLGLYDMPEDQQLFYLS